METLLIIGGLVLLALIAFALLSRRAGRKASRSRGGQGRLPGEPDAGSSFPPSHPQVPIAPVMEGARQDRADEGPRPPEDNPDMADDSWEQDREAARRRGDGGS